MEFDRFREQVADQCAGLDNKKERKRIKEMDPI